MTAKDMMRVPPGVFLVVFLVVTTPPSTARADTYYVDADAPNDDGSGSVDAPWKTVERLQAAVTPGDVVYFDSSDTWSHVSGQSILTAKGGVTYIGDEWGAGTRARLLLTADMHSEGSGIVQISTDHPSYETAVKGFELDGNGHVCNGFDMKKSTTGPLVGANKRIENCFIHDTLASNSSHRALAVGSVNNRDIQNVEIINNTLSDSPRSGINFYNQIDCSTCRTSHVLIRGNTVYGSGYTGDGAGAGIVLKNWTTDCIIERNVLFGNKNRGIAFDADGAPGAQDVIIRHNVIYDNAKGGIYFQNAGDKSADIYGNLIFENRDEGSGGTGIYFESNLGGKLSARIYNNTIYRNANGGILVASSGASFTALDIRNNIISSASGKFPYRDVRGGNVTIHSNNLYYRPDGGVLVRDGSSSLDAAALSSWEPSALSSEPLFEDVSDLPDGFTLVGMPNTSGLIILQGSPARDTGADLGHGYGVSINGLTRPVGSGWDIGAYEYCPQDDECRAVGAGGTGGSGGAAGGGGFGGSAGTGGGTAESGGASGGGDAGEAGSAGAAGSIAGNLGADAGEEGAGFVGEAGSIAGNLGADAGEEGAGFVGEAGVTGEGGSVSGEIGGRDGAVITGTAGAAGIGSEAYSDGSDPIVSANGDGGGGCGCHTAGAAGAAGAYEFTGSIAWLMGVLILVARRRRTGKERA